MLPLLLTVGLVFAAPKKRGPKPEVMWLGPHGGLTAAPTGLAYRTEPSPVLGWSAGMAGQKNLKAKRVSVEVAAGYHRFATPGADASWAIMAQQAWRLRLWRVGKLSQHAGLGFQLHFGVFDAADERLPLFSGGPAVTTTLQWAPTPPVRLALTPYLAPQLNLGGLVRAADGRDPWNGTYVGHGGVFMSLLFRTVLPSKAAPSKKPKKKRQF